jgi:hypothetical protein
MFSATEPEGADNAFTGETEGTDSISESEKSEDNEGNCK